MILISSDSPISRIDVHIDWLKIGDNPPRGVGSTGGDGDISWFDMAMEWVKIGDNPPRGVGSTGDDCDISSEIGGFDRGYTPRFLGIWVGSTGGLGCVFAQNEGVRRGGMATFRAK